MLWRVYNTDTNKVIQKDAQAKYQVPFKTKGSLFRKYESIKVHIIFLLQCYLLQGLQSAMVGLY